MSRAGIRTPGCLYSSRGRCFFGMLVDAEWLLSTALGNSAEEFCGSGGEDLGNLFGG